MSPSKELDGLIALPQHPPAIHRTALKGSLALFFVLLVGTALIDALGWTQQPQPWKPATSQASAWELFVRGDLARHLETSLKTHSVVRSYALPVYVYGLYMGLGDLGNDLLVGSKRWVFFPHRVKARLGSDRKTIETAIFRITELQRRMATLGSRLVFMPIPRKSALLPEYLPRGYDDNHHLDTLLSAALRSQDVDAVDLLPSFQNLARTAAPYFRADSHWTENAAKRAAEETARHLGLWKPQEARRSSIQTFPRPSQFDFLIYAGGPKTARVARFWNREIFERHGVSLPGDARLMRPTIAWNSSRDYLLTGTSFVGGSRFSALLGHFTQLPWLDISRSGCPPMAPLETFIEYRRQANLPLPEIIVQEVPNDVLLGPFFGAPRSIIPLDKPVQRPAMTGELLKCYQPPKHSKAPESLPKALFRDGFETGDLRSWKPVAIDPGTPRR